MRTVMTTGEATLVLLALCSGCRTEPESEQDTQAGTDRELHDSEPVPDARTADVADGADEAPPPAESESAADTAFRSYPRHRNGSRLRARVLDGGQGATQFLSFHDDRLETDCELSLAEDGEYRCLPQRERAQGQIYYLDRECTQPVFRAFWDAVPATDLHPRSGCAAAVGSFVRESAGPDELCNEARRERVYRVGQPRTAATIYVKDRLGCEAVGMDECLHDVAAISPAGFVRGRIRTEFEDNDLASDWVVYEDGSRAAHAMRDATRDLACTSFATADGERCLPADQAHSFGQDFVEARCSGKHVAIDSSRAPCMRARIALSWERTACATYSLTPHELGPPVPRLFVKSEQACAEREPYWFEWMYELGPRIELGTLPRLQRARAGVGRLAVQYFATASGTPLHYAAAQDATAGQPSSNAAFYDHELDGSCEAERFTDGVRRCVPAYRADRRVITDWQAGPHADSACARRIVFLPSPDACDSRPSYVRVLDAGSGEVEAVHAIADGLPVHPRQVYFRVAGDCNARTTDSSGTYYELGEALELATVSEHLE
jgi:hypothetical protein